MSSATKRLYRRRLTSMLHIYFYNIYNASKKILNIDEIWSIKIKKLYNLVLKILKIKISTTIIIIILLNILNTLPFQLGCNNKRHILK
jgi:hypothetical protein